MKLVITGPRDFFNKTVIHTTLDRFYAQFQQELPNDTLEIVEGGATGVDTLAREWAKANGVKFKTFKADWDKHGKVAGPIRNKQMADYGDAVMAFLEEPPTRGTGNMVMIANRAGMDVVEINI